MTSGRPMLVADGERPRHIHPPVEDRHVAEELVRDPAAPGHPWTTFVLRRAHDGEPRPPH
jgi:hypothetical protein